MIDPYDIMATLKSDGITAFCNELEYDEDYEHIIEAWKGDRKLSIFLGDEMLVIRVWGSNIHDEMSEHECTPQDLAIHLEWLQEK